MFSICMGCGKKEHPFYEYTEVTNVQQHTPPATTGPEVKDTPATSPSMNTPYASKGLSYDVPETWSELGASGMRLNAFESPDKNVTITLISLGAQAGSLASNVERWLGQLGVNQLPTTTLQEYIQSLTGIQHPEGWKTALIDLTSFLPEKANETTIAVVLYLPDQTVFVKATGERTATTAEKEKVIQFSRSLRIKTSHDSSGYE